MSRAYQQELKRRKEIAERAAILELGNLDLDINVRAGLRTKVKQSHVIIDPIRARIIEKTLELVKGVTRHDAADLIFKYARVNRR